MVNKDINVDKCSEVQPKMQRLATFANYRNEKNIFLCKLSGGGFSYQGYENALECADCGFLCNSWEDIDDLFRRHRQHSPSCRFVQQSRNRGNIQTLKSKTNDVSRGASNLNMGSSENTELPRASKSRDSESAQQSESVLTPRSESNRQANLESAKQVFQKLGIHIDLNRSKHPAYAVLASRISSFTSVDTKAFHRPVSAMAQAGFFYKGYSDNVCCFSCGGSLSEWRPEDDPWVEHAYWYPKCTFLIQNKGEDFVQKVQLVKQADDDQDRGSRLGADVLGGGGGAWSGEDEIDSVTLSVVMEMGYTEEQVRTAFDSLRARNPTNCPIQTEEVVDTLLQLGEEVTPLSSGLAGQGERRSVTLTENHDCSTKSLGSEIKKNHLTDLQTVLRENRELQDMTICKVCMVGKVNIVFLPCGHIVTCAECAPAMRKCPMCRKMVMGTIKAFMS